MRPRFQYICVHSVSIFPPEHVIIRRGETKIYVNELRKNSWKRDRIWAQSVLKNIPLSRCSIIILQSFSAAVSISVEPFHPISEPTQSFSRPVSLPNPILIPLQNDFDLTMSRPFRPSKGVLRFADILSCNCCKLEFLHYYLLIIYVFRRTQSRDFSIRIGQRRRRSSWISSHSGMSMGSRTLDQLFVN